MRAIVGVLVSLLAAGSAAQAPEASTEAGTATGTIVMYRPSAFLGYSTACPIRYKGREVVELGRGKFAKWVVPAGRYILGNKTSSVEVTVSPGQTEFVRCTMKDGIIWTAALQIVDQETFAQHSGDYKEKPVELASGL